MFAKYGTYVFMYHKRIYQPVHVEKYDGDPTNIIMRSSWETKFAVWCDNNENVLKWSSESTVIPYICPTDNKMHRYYVDFKVQIKDKNNDIKTYLVEIKPQSQTHPPAIQQKKTQRYLTEVMMWGKNEAKWAAARKYCESRGYEFIILNEYDLGIR